MCLNIYRKVTGDLNILKYLSRGSITLKYLGTTGEEINWDLIRLALSSVADTAIIPFQDVLGLGSEARMNTPGTASGNWEWRFRKEMLTSKIAERLKELTEISDR